MQSAPVEAPRKTRELQNIVMDSTRWNGFPFRDDDIVIATYAKSGTTWTQQIVGQLIFQGAEDLPVMDLCPWVDFTPGPPKEVVDELLAAQTHRRFLKTHLPLDALVFSPQAKYLYIGRDGRDTAWSLFHHFRSFTDEGMKMMNDRPGRFGPPAERPADDVVRFFHEWLDGDSPALGSFWHHNQSWWNARHLPNVRFVHFNNLKADLPGQMRRIAEFLGIDVAESLWPTLVEHCTFDYMKAHADKLSPILDHIFQGGGTTFINKGTNGRWRDMLSASEVAQYERIASERLTPDCAHWLATGEA